jgi:uncharacterized RDD family membrane protein YckC
LWSLVPFAIDYIVGLTLGGQTLGMRLVSVRVTRIDRPASVGFVRAVIRTVLLMLFIPAVIVDKHNRGLHDRLTDTAVVPVRV